MSAKGQEWTLPVSFGLPRPTGLVAKKDPGSKKGPAASGWWPTAVLSVRSAARAQINFPQSQASAYRLGRVQRVKVQSNSRSVHGVTTMQSDRPGFLQGAPGQVTLLIVTIIVMHLQTRFRKFVRSLRDVACGVGETEGLQRRSICFGQCRPH